VDAAQVELQSPQVVNTRHRRPKQERDEANLEQRNPKHMAPVAGFAGERLRTSRRARGFFADSGLGHGWGLKQIRLKIQILTIFPEVCRSVLSESILKRAQEKNLARLEAVDLRDWTSDRHRTVDDTPYGGGPGMVMKIEPIDLALTQIRSPESKVILMTPQGRKFSDAIARELALEKDLILLCGHYEGIDQRVSDHLVDDEISIGDYVLTSGVLPALVVTDAVVRLIPGVLGDCDSAQQDSFADGILDHPHYTRPADYKGWKVPEVLLGGNHAAIEKWRREAALEATKKRRPDLLDR
jgi:tRNA (guanine37-N1)-methyltransferase